MYSFTYVATAGTSLGNFHINFLRIKFLYIKTMKGKHERLNFFTTTVVLYKIKPPLFLIYVFCSCSFFRRTSLSYPPTAVVALEST